MIYNHIIDIERFRLLSLICLLLSAVAIRASFIMVEPGVPMLSYGNLAFGDYDNDGDLDLLTIGSYSWDGVSSNQAKLFRNDGNWQYTLTQHTFGNFVYGCASWGDYDNDGWLDVVISGSSSIGSTSSLMILFHNNAGTSFTHAPYTFYNRSNSSHVWADVDNDFDLDLIVIGTSSTLGMFGDLCIYYNLGNEEFLYNTLPALPNFLGWPGYLDATDFDRDGYLDLSIGANRVYGGIGSAKTLVLRQSSLGTYENIFEDDIGGGGGHAWFDHDNDGDLDYIYTGYQNNIGSDTVLMRNNNGTYMNASHSFPSTNGEIATADYDNDGDEDVLIMGQMGGAFTYLYRNDDNGVFTEAGNGFQSMYRSNAFWIDIDNDSDLDLAYTGDMMGSYTMFYRNDTTTQNLPPTPPTLSYSAENGFIFSGSIDSVTPQHALTYDLRIGTSTGATDVYHPMANPITGYRRIEGPGRPSFLAHRLPNGYIYYASAQAIDGGFMGSAWGPEIVIDLTVGNEDPIQAITEFQIYPNPFSNKLTIHREKAPVSDLKASIYNLKGQFIKQLEFSGKDNETRMYWDGRDVHGKSSANGVYYLQISESGKTSVHKVLLIR